jgi:Methyltransferase domain
MADRIAKLWPSSALLSWALAWGLAQQQGWVAGCLFCGACGLLHRRPWRRALVALGLPLVLLAQGFTLPPWLWLLLLGVLLLLYPWQHWRDAPLFMTPDGALDELPALLSLPAGARVLDAGCGSGAGLRAWQRAYPQLALEGVEASWPLALWTRWRCPFARVRRGDFWADDWAPFKVIYMFQRPESMSQALEKARAQMATDAWLISLDFELPDQQPRWQLQAGQLGRHRLLVYAVSDLRQQR